MSVFVLTLFIQLIIVLNLLVNLIIIVLIAIKIAPNGGFNRTIVFSAPCRALHGTKLLVQHPSRSMTFSPELVPFCTTGRKDNIDNLFNIVH